MKRYSNHCSHTLWPYKSVTFGTIHDIKPIKLAKCGCYVNLVYNLIIKPACIWQQKYRCFSGAFTLEQDARVADLILPRSAHMSMIYQFLQGTRQCTPPLSSN